VSVELVISDGGVVKEILEHGVIPIGGLGWEFKQGRHKKSYVADAVQSSAK
jgi:hypothetical protein